MKRDVFLKNLALSLGAVVMTPTIISAKDTPPIESPNLAIDLNSISNIVVGGHRIPPIEIIDLYNQTGILFYRSEYNGVKCNPPIIFKGEIKVIDVSKLPKKG